MNAVCIALSGLMLAIVGWQIGPLWLLAGLASLGVCAAVIWHEARNG
jgi:hypothetical protein